MKAQISRDSFVERKDYSAVYQQQGRMLTDADWNEMVRLLKRRMDRTVGAAIESGSPREGGILEGAQASYGEFAAAPRFRWGRVYVDGLYGELRRAPPALEAERAATPVTHEWSGIALATGFSAPPVLLAAMQTFAGDNPAGLRLRGRTALGMEVKVEEETSRDNEIAHNAEEIGYLALAPGEIRDADGRRIGEAGIVETSQPDGTTWHAVALEHAYADPVVLMQLMSFRGAQPAHTRVRNVSADAFEFRIEEWEYLDQVHASEEIGYVVLERGRHRLADETALEVGTVATDHTWAGVSFGEPFTKTPVVLSHCQTVNGSSAVVTRQRGATPGGLELRLQEEEAGGAHARETIGYVAASANQRLSILDLVRYQRDFPASPWNRLQNDGKYVVYIDLWERLVVALEDAALTDVALHGADTCVRTQTMAQVKLAPAGFEPAAQPPHGSAKLAVTVPTPLSVVGPHDCNKDAPGTEAFTLKNTLLRLEVHALTRAGGEVAGVTLKWSAENGAEERRNGQTLESYLTPDYVYECFSTATEMHLGEHPLEGVNGWQRLASTLYSRAEYQAALAVAGSPAAAMPRIRRWDGSVRLDRNTASGQWSIAGGPTALASIEGAVPSVQRLKLNLKADDRSYVVTLSLDAGDMLPERFMAGDYWLVLLRDDGSDLSAQALSAEPVGIEHHYMGIGQIEVDAAGAVTYTLDKPTWRRLSFPSLTRLTLDRVLVEDSSGNEISIDDKFVDVEGDSMTGPLVFLDPKGREVMTLSSNTADAGNPRILFEPPGSGPEAAWTRARTQQDPALGVHTTLELGVRDAQLDNILLRGAVRISTDNPATASGHAKELATQAGHAEAGRGFLDTPWVYSGNLQGTGNAGMHGTPFEGGFNPRISLGRHFLATDWDQPAWADAYKTSIGVPGFGTFSLEPIGFGFNKGLQALLSQTGHFAARQALHAPELSHPKSLKVQSPKVSISSGNPGPGKILGSVDASGQVAWMRPDQVPAINDALVLAWLRL